MASIPNNTGLVGGVSSTIQEPTGSRGDNGVGPSGQPPVDIDRYDNTENVHNRNKLQDSHELAGDVISSFPKYPESPFTRYVSRPLSNGNLSDSLVNFSPEDRSKIGTPLNPFWIRNDLWSIANEADIFMDAGPNWVTPRIHVNGNQTKQGFLRQTYLDNQEQPQRSNETAPIGPEVLVPPTTEAAGKVTGLQTIPESDMEMIESNPAKVKTEVESESKETSIPPGENPTENTPQTSSEETLSSEKPPPKKRSKKKLS